MEEQQPKSITHFQETALLYDWNQVPPLTCQFERPEQVELNDETLRDGLQCPSVVQPTLEQKLALLRLLPCLGIGSADIGYPGATTAALEDVVALAKNILVERLPVAPNCAGRTHAADITPIAEAEQRSGQAQYIETPLVVADEDEPLGTALSWMTAHLHEDLTVEQMAARAVMSPRTFARRFRASLGASPYHWLLQQRIALAQRLLETTDEPIERIAVCCGFSSAATLRLHFGRFLHVSPQAYRNTFHSASA